MWQIKVWLLGCVSFAVTLSGCAEEAPLYSRLGEHDARIFADSVSVALEMYDPLFFLFHSDANRLTDRLDEWGLLPDDQRNEASAYLKQIRLVDFVLEGNPTENTDYVYTHLNRFRQDSDSNIVVQFRVHDRDFNVNYLEFLLEKHRYEPSYTVAISDLYSYNLGMWISQFAYHQYLADHMLQSRAGLNGVTPLDSIYELVGEGEFRRADRAWHALPGEVKQLVVPNRLHLEIAEHISENHFEEALAVFHSRHPEDEFLLRRRIQWAYFSENFKEFHRLIDRLENRLGGPDAYTVWSHGDAWQLANELDSAETCFRLAAAMEESFFLPHISLFYIYLECGHYDQAVGVLAQLEENFGIDAGMLDLDKYPRFINSDALVAYMTVSDPMPGGE